MIEIIRSHFAGMPKRSPEPPPYHHGDLRNALIAEGRRLLEEVGARELSLRHVVRAVGVSIAAPSRHFEGKEGLLAAIAADGFRELAAERRRIAASTPDPLARLYRMLESYVRFAQRKKGLFDLMVGPRILARGGYPELTSAGTESFDLFAAAGCEYARACGWPEKDLNFVVHAAWAVEHGVATLLLADRVPRVDRPIDVTRMVHFTLSMLLSGIAAGPVGVERIARAISPR
jgi:AcrR family transcriptional regulator